MKGPIVILGSATVALLLVALWWLNRSIPAPPPFVPPEAPTTPPLTYQVPGKGEYQGLSDPRWKWWNEMEKRDTAFEWKMPISFYAKLVDQDDRPIAEAKVRYGWNDVEGSKERFDQSDANGLFSLTGVTGKVLSVRVEKNGYHAGKEAFGAYEYAAFFEPHYHEPDPNNPVIFRLFKKLDAESLVVHSTFNSLSYEQGTYYFNLQRGTISRQPPAGEGLKLTITRGRATQGQPFDWTWTVEGVNTTLQVTTDEFPQIAPTDGYVQSSTIGQKADEERFQRQAQVRLYLRTRENHYGRVDLELSHPNAREVGPTLSAKSYLNPSGSRNLEYDPAKVTTAAN
jgi:hypothetical protein